MARTGIAARAPAALSTRAERISALALPSLADTLFILCLAGVTLGLQGRALGSDGDIGWHLRQGLLTLSGQLPRYDTLSSTASGQPLVDMEWLGEAAYALVWRAAGLNGVVALAGLLIAITGAGLLLALRARGTPILLALPLALLAVALTSIHWVARPHLFSLPLLLWWSEWLWRYWRDGRRWRLWCFPPVLALWANLHGYFLDGLLLLGSAVVVAWIFRRDRGRAEPLPLTLALGASALAMLATPWGLALPQHYLTFFAVPDVIANTQEWQSPDFHTLAARIFLLLLFLLVAAWIFASRAAPTRPPRDTAPASLAADMPAAPRLAGPEPLAWVVAGVFTALALMAVRSVPLWAVVVTPIIGEALTAWIRTLATDARPEAGPGWITRLAAATLARSARLDSTERQIGRGAWSALVVVLLGLMLAGGGRLPGTRAVVLRAAFSSRDFPVAAVAQLQRAGLPPGRGFNTAEWGGYLEYALPTYRDFVDTRTDFYSPALLRDYLTMVDAAPGWRRLFTRYQIHWALLPQALPLTQLLASTPGWTCHALDDQGVASLCVQTSPGPPSSQ